MKVAIYCSHIDRFKTIVDGLKKELAKASFVIDDNEPETVIVVGGDGTFLSAVHHYINNTDNVKFIGLGCGNLGFFFDYKAVDLSLLVNDLKKKNYKTKEYPLIEGKIVGQSEETILAINEIRIENPFHTLISNVFIDDEQLETFRGNGLVVASEVGSSAYNKSLGGGVVDHALNVLELTEIAPIENNVFRSLGSSFIIDGHKTITFRGDLKDVVIGYDNLLLKEKNPSEISITKSNKTITIIHKDNYSYIHSIKRSFVND